MSRVVEHMDFVHDGASLVAKQEEEEDRISKLPEDIIHHILGFLDMKHAIQTSKLSRKWRHIWTTMPHLNFNSELFRTKQKFGYFVKHALSRRTIDTKVSAVQLTFTGAPAVSVGNIVNYAYSHNVTEMNIVWFIRESFELPRYLFSSNTLKHLTIAVRNPYCTRFGNNCFLPESAWDFPALETLSLKDTRFRFGAVGSDKNLNLFSKCVKLKDVTLHNFSFYDFKIFNICAPQLSNLTITNAFYFPEVFNVVAPKLQNLRASINSESEKPFSHVLRFSTESFSSLERVNLSWFMTRFSRYKKESCVPGLLDLFQKLHSAKYLILDLDIIEILSSSLDQLSREPCPFNNLKSVKIDTVLIEKEGRIASIPVQVRNYLLQNSPNATFIMDLPQVPPTGLKRLTQEVNNNTMANKVAKLDVPTVEPSSASNPSSSDAQNLLLLKVPHQISRQQVRNDVKKMENLEVPPMRVKRPMQTMHNDTMANKMAKLDVPTSPKLSSSNVPHQISTHEVHNDGTTTYMANVEAVEKQPEKIPEDKIMLEAKIQMQDQLIAEQKAMFEAKIQMQDKVIANLKEKVQMQDEVLAKQKATFEAKVQMQDEITANQNTSFEAKIQVQDKVIAKQKSSFETKIQMQDKVLAKQKATFKAKVQMQSEFIAKQKATFEAKIQMQDEAIAKQKAMYEAKTQMVEATKLQHEKLMSLIIKSKIAELKVKIESGNPGHEVNHSTGVDIGSVMDLLPESLRVNLEARFSLMYEGFKSLFLTHFNDSQWENIKSELEKEYKGFLD